MQHSVLHTMVETDNKLWCSLASDLVPEDHANKSQLLALLKSNVTPEKKVQMADSKLGKAEEAQDANSNLPPQVAAFKVSFTVYSLLGLIDTCVGHNRCGGDCNNAKLYQWSTQICKGFGQPICSGQARLY